MTKRASVDGAILPVALLIFWEAGGRAGFVAAYLATPSQIATEFGQQLGDASYYGDVFASLLRAYVGFALGACVGICCGLLAGMSTAVRNFFDPLVSFLYPVPKVAFFPIFFILFGLGHGSQIAPVFLTVFFPVFISARYSLMSLDKFLLWAGRSMGASRQTIFFRVIVPAGLPQLFTGLRVGLAHSFVVLFAAELIGARSGLGFFIIDAENAVRFDRMMVGIVTFGILGFVSDRALMLLRGHLLRGSVAGTAEQVMT